MLSPTEIVGLTIYGEGRGEPVEGQIGIGCVIRNRLHSNPNKTYHQIVLAPKQFSCWNISDPNRAMLVELAQKIIYGNPDIYLRQCFWIAQGVIGWSVVDNTHAAFNYLTAELYKRKPPTWAKKMKVTKEIGRHIFLTP